MASASLTVSATTASSVASVFALTVHSDRDLPVAPLGAVPALTSLSMRFAIYYLFVFDGKLRRKSHAI